MQAADNEFFEEYKHLDKLCSEMYSCRNGVSEYISQMEYESYQGQRYVSQWNTDYKMLKHVRAVRNQIAHDSGAYQISESEDLTFVREFYSRIFSGQDSLTLLRKAINAKNERREQQKKQQREQASATAASHSRAPINYTSANKKSHAWIGILIGVVVFVLILFFILYFSFIFPNLTDLFILPNCIISHFPA